MLTRNSLAVANPNEARLSVSSKDASTSTARCRSLPGARSRRRVVEKSNVFALAAEAPASLPSMAARTTASVTEVASTALTVKVTTTPTVSVLEGGVVGRADGGSVGAREGGQDGA